VIISPPAAGQEGPATEPSDVQVTAGDGQVTLTWNAIEGVNKYRVYFTDCSSIFFSLEDLDSIDTTTNSTTIKGLANGITYDFYVVSIKNSNYIDKIDTSKIVQATPIEGIGAGNMEIDMEVGWNLVSFWLEPDDSSIDSIFYGAEGMVVSVWKWTDNTWAVYLPAFEDGGKAYADAKGFILLDKIKVGEGFWVNAMNEYTLNIGGTSCADKSIEIKQGWNLVGLKTDQTISVVKLIEGNENKIMSLWKWVDNTWAVYLPPYGAEATQNYANAKGFIVLENIDPGEGFWINAKKAFSVF